MSWCPVSDRFLLGILSLSLLCSPSILFHSLLFSSCSLIHGRIIIHYFFDSSTRSSIYTSIGFYDDIAPGDPNNDPQMKVVVESGEFSLDEYRQQLGVPRLTGHRRYTPAEVLHQRWQRPNLSVVDVRVNETEVRGTSHAGAKHPAAHLDGNHGSGEGHYRYGPTRFSVIPRKAIGQVSIRYVPNQRAEILTESLRRHCEHEFFKLRSPNSLRLHIHSRGDWWQVRIIFLLPTLISCLELYTVVRGACLGGPNLDPDHVHS